MSSRYGPTPVCELLAQPFQSRDETRSSVPEGIETSQYLMAPIRRALRKCEVIEMQFQSPDRILRVKSVLERTGLSRSTLYRKMQNGSFPKNILISERCAGWRESAIDDWLRDPGRYSANK